MKKFRISLQAIFFVFCFLCADIFSLNYENNSNQEKKYRLSIITSLYKGEQFIRGFMEDMIRQTIFNECELIIINANSPENEEPIIEEYVRRYGNIVYKRLEKDPGIYGVWNLGIKMAKAEYITNANVDDRFSPYCYEAHVNYLDANPDVDLTYSGCYVTKSPNETFENNSSKGEILKISTSKFDRKAMLFERKCYPNNHPVWRKSLHKYFGMFDEKFKSSGDLDFWIRAATLGGANFKKIDGVYSLYYFSPTGMSTSKNSPGREETQNIVQKYKKLWEEHFKDIEYMH